MKTFEAFAVGYWQGTHVSLRSRPAGILISSKPSKVRKTPELACFYNQYCILMHRLDYRAEDYIIQDACDDQERYL